MDLANWLYRTSVCVAVLGGGCVDESSAPDEADEDAILPALKLAPGDGGGGKGGDGEVVDVEVLDVTIPASLHAQGLAVPAKLVRPKWSKPVGKRPGMLVLHGSGGLLKMPKSKADKPCSAAMEAQFADWSQRLAEMGYTVLLPSSYSARGFCDEHKDTGRIPKTFDEKPEVVLGRLYDADAAARFLCGRPEVDCERMGMLGFSQGATAVMTMLHWQDAHAIQQYRAANAGKLDIEVPDLAPGAPDFQIGVAYYPGCGFDGFVGYATGAKAKSQEKFASPAPLVILHGSEDPLVEHCSTQYGKGTRQIQAGEVAKELKIADSYEITVYPKAGHSFDSPGGSGSGGGHPGDAAARDAALAVTKQKLAEYLD